jgi:hypothetical protein
VVVEQVGGGAAGYLLRRLLPDTTRQAVDALDTEAETPGQAAYAAIEGPVVLGLALLRLAEQTVEVLGTAPGRDDVRTALVERAQHDAAAAGLVGVLRIES